MSFSRKRALELTLEVLVGLTLVGAVVLYAEIGPFPWMPGLRWWSLAGFTGVLIWVTVRPHRRHWRRTAFWLNITWLTALHLASWSVVLSKAQVWGTLWFVPPIAIEAALFGFVLYKLGYGLPE